MILRHFIIKRAIILRRIKCNFQNEEREKKRNNGITRKI